MIADVITNRLGSPSSVEGIHLGLGTSACAKTRSRECRFIRTTAQMSALYAPAPGCRGSCSSASCCARRTAEMSCAACPTGPSPARRRRPPVSGRLARHPVATGQ